MAEQADHGTGQGASPDRDPGASDAAAPHRDPGVSGVSGRPPHRDFNQPDGAARAPSRGPGLPGGTTGRAPGRDAHLAGFAGGGQWDDCPPSAALAVAAEAASGPEWRCAGASRDEMFGLLRQWQALESRAAAGKLAVLRALIREDDQPLPGGGYHGDLPDGWTKSLAHEVALALSMPAVSADRLLWLAWDLEGRLPGVGGLLAAGKLTAAKAKAVGEALQQLPDEDAAAAEALILPELPGKTYGQVVKLAVHAAVTVDPDSAARRREDAERNRSRVEMFREQSGAAALAGRELPTDQALAANANVCGRAVEYQESGAFPDGTRMDQYRVAAFLDLLNGVSADERIAAGLLPGTGPAGEPSASEAPPGEQSAGKPADGDSGGDPDCGHGCSCRECDGSCLPPDDEDPGDEDPDEDGDPGDNDLGGDPDDGEPEGPSPDGARPTGGSADGGVPSGPAPGGGAPGGSEPDGLSADGGQPHGDSGQDSDVKPDADRGPAADGAPDTRQPATPAAPARLADLVLPLATLLGLAERPGEGYRLGPLDPDLSRALAIAAVGSQDSRLCVTVTDPDGIAIGHGCARAARRGRILGTTSNGGTAKPPGAGPGHGTTALPARANLTITTARLAQLAELTEATGPPGQAAWSFTPDTDPGPPGGYGTWTLTLPDGRTPTVQLRPVPTFDCDHRNESHAYQPNDTLRHLVQIRDGECTFPPCSRHARETDFEHATPYDKGGRTCACNAGARSRACHQVKQSPGWNVTQPRPGWHQWETPSGRVYIQGPKQYPV